MHQALHERHTIDTVLAEARARLDRWRPVEAWTATQTGGALIIDIRTPTDRTRDGVIPGSLHLPRTVLEWRVDPTSSTGNCCNRTVRKHQPSGSLLLQKPFGDNPLPPVAAHAGG